MSAPAEVAAEVSCARCSRTTKNPKRDNWQMRKTPLVIQDVTLGLCAHCATGLVPPADTEGLRCPQDCDGRYQSARGIYYIAEWGEVAISKGRSWACWDRECVDAWLEEQDYECEACGHYVDMDVYEVTSGKRKRVAS